MFRIYVFVCFFSIMCLIYVVRTMAMFSCRVYKNIRLHFKIVHCNLMLAQVTFVSINALWLGSGSVSGRIQLKLMQKRFQKRSTQIGRKKGRDAGRAKGCRVTKLTLNFSISSSQRVGAMNREAWRAKGGHKQREKETKLRTGKTTKITKEKQFHQRPT